MPWYVWLLMAIATGCQLAYTCTHFQIVFPDEIYQSLEQAHRVVFGYGMVPWEFDEGARAWVFPGFLAGVLEIAKLCGIGSGHSIAIVAKCTMVLVATGALVCAARLALLIGDRLAAVIAVAILGFYPPAFEYAGRCFSEVASAPLLTGAVLLALGPGARRQIIAGVLLAIAFYVRYQNGMVAACLVAVILLQKRYKDCAYLIAVGAALGIIIGLSEIFTWHAAFHSLRKYVQFNLVEHGSVHFGVRSVWFYARELFAALGPLSLVLIVGCGFAPRRAWPLALVSVVYIFAHNLIGHKEFRFLLPVLPVAIVWASTGVARALLLWPMRIVAPAVCIAIFIPTLFWSRYASDRRNREAARSGNTGVINRLLFMAGERDDLCGLAINAERFIWLGGYAYLHRDVNVYEGAPNVSAANYIIAPLSKTPTGYQPVAQIERFYLSRRGGDCSPQKVLRAFGKF